MHRLRRIAGLRQAGVHDVAEKPVRGRPAKQVGGPSSLGVARPGEDSAETVLPGCQQRIALRALQHDVGGGARRRRHIAGERREAVEWHTGNHVRQRGELRRDPTYDGLKIFAVSGHDPAEYDLARGPAGVDRWFQKPIDPQELLRRVEQELADETVCV